MNPSSLKFLRTRNKQIIVALLLTLGINLGATDVDDLADKVWENDIGQVQLLIKKDVNVNTLDNEGHLPLYYAAYKGHTKIVKLLINAGANVNLCWPYGATTALYYAVISRRREVIFLLLNNGATINNTINSVLLTSLTPLQIAVAQGNTQTTLSTLKLLASIRKTNIYISPQVLEIPAICGDANMMYFLLQYNPSEDVVKNAFLKIEDETDDKSMFIKAMLVYYKKYDLSPKFYELMIEAAAKYKQVDLFLLGSSTSKNIEEIHSSVFRDTLMSHVVRKKNVFDVASIMDHLKSAMNDLRNALSIETLRRAYVFGQFLKASRKEEKEFFKAQFKKDSSQSCITDEEIIEWYCGGQPFNIQYPQEEEKLSNK